MTRVRILSELMDEEAVEAAARAIRENYGDEVIVEYVEELVGKEALNRGRRQYDAWKIVQAYREARGEDEYLLLVVDKDLYAAGLNYVFGLAWRGVAVVSAYRLRQEFYGLEPNRRLFIERLMKEAVHEVGHLYGLTHCGNRRCVMAFSNWIGDTDYKSWRLCQRCAARVKR